MSNSLTINFRNCNTSKPSTKQAKVAESNNTCTTLSNVCPYLFAELVVGQGRSFCPALFKGGKRLNDNWLQQDVFMLDFDDNTDYNLVVERFEQYGINPNVLYTTFSDTPEHRKFRVVLFLNKTIKDPLKAKELILSLLWVFPEADIAVKDFARLSFGGKEVIHFEDTLVDVKNIAEIVFRYRESQEAEKNRLSGLFKGSAVSGEHKQDEQDVKGQYGATLLPSQRVVVCGDVSKSIRKINKKNFNFNLAIERIEILRDLVEGRWLYHSELFGLATNLKYINSGLDFMKEAMIEANRKGAASYGSEKFDMLEQVRNSNYKSQRLSQFSQYPDDHQWQNVFNACLIQSK